MEAPTRQRKDRIGPQLSSATTSLDFGKALRRFADNTNKKMGEIHRNVSIKLFNNILFETPVLTGLARGSWTASMGGPGPGVGNEDPTGNRVKAQIELAITTDVSQVAYLANRLPYIVQLEYGWSNKAPEGMVRVNVHQFQRLVSEEAAK